MNLNYLTLQEVIQEANNFMDTNPSFVTSSEIEVTQSNTKASFYKDRIELYCYERFIRFKLRDSEQKIEYQLSLKPWRAEFDLIVWNDGGGSILPKNSPNCSGPFARSEEEYFQKSTVRDLSKLPYEVIKSVTELHDRIFEYFNIKPCAQEFFDE